MEDYYETIDQLTKVAGSIQEANKPELAERGLKEINESEDE